MNPGGLRSTRRVLAVCVSVAGLVLTPNATAGQGGVSCERVLRDPESGLEIQLPENWCGTPWDARASGAVAGWRLAACGALAHRLSAGQADCGVLWLHTPASMRAAEERAVEAARAARWRAIAPELSAVRVRARPRPQSP